MVEQVMAYCTLLHKRGYDKGRGADTQRFERNRPLRAIRRVRWDSRWWNVVKEPTMLVVINNHEAIFPKGIAAAHGFINLHKEFLAITNAGGRMIISAGAGVRCVLIGWLNENH